MHVKDSLRPDVRRRYWIVQRVVWALMAVFLVLAVIGVFGSGIISHGSATTSGDGVHVAVDYERIARMKRPQRLTVVVDAPGAEGDRITVALSRSFAESIRVHGVIPEAGSAELGPDGAVYGWDVDDWSEPFSISIEYQAEHWRAIEAVVTVTAGTAPPQRVSFSQFVFP